MADFDYVIVGAGSSGCVLADRLSADGSATVLLLEAGTDNETELVRMPRAFLKMWGDPRYFWSFPVSAREGRTASDTWWYGRGLGGSSSTNGTWYMRGEPADYDAWHALGLPEWSWAEAERCYRAMESYHDAEAHGRRGRDGPLHIRKLPFRSPFLAAVIEASSQMGLPYLGDINSPGRQGIGYSQASVDRNGRRASAYRMFLKPAMGRPNLTVRTGALVERIELEGKRAVGVRYQVDGRVEAARARRETILSAGTLQSPKLLQVSGIGPGQVLQRAGVPVVMDAPAVGRNLADHVTFSLAFRMKGYAGANREFSGWRLLRHVAQYYASRTGLMAFTCPELTAMLAMDSPAHWPDVQIGIGPFSMRSTEELKADPGRGALEPEPGYTLNGYYLRPRSRGAVEIRSGNIADPIVVDAHLWRDPEDRQTLIRICSRMRALASMPALQPYTVREVTPGAQHASEEEIGKALDWLAGPGLHATGTCRMGAAADSVLDSRLKVRGIERLRVADCSAMPAPPSGNTNAPAMMLGFRAAELIIDDHHRRA